MTTDWDAQYEQDAREADASGACAIDDKTALVTPAYFQKLYEYSTSAPTGVYFGKRWKARKMARVLASNLLERQTVSKLVLTDDWVMRSFERIPGDTEHARTVERDLLVIA